MKKLFIIRHAKSSWKDEGLDDFDRSLNKRGKKNITLMSNWLKSNNYYPDIILSSPAKRAKKTLKTILKTLDIDEKIVKFDEKIYDATLNDLLKILVEIDKKQNNVFLIGHNPSLNELAEFLSNSVIFNIPTSGIFCMEFDIKEWADIKNNKGKILFFEFPKKIEKAKSEI